jgi:hypothetical protein
MSGKTARLCRQHAAMEGVRPRTMYRIWNSMHAKERSTARPIMVEEVKEWRESKQKK